VKCGEMAALMRIAESLIADKLLTTTAALQGNHRIIQYLSVVVGLFGLAGLIFLVYGAHLWLASYYRADSVAMITGLISLFVSLLFACAIFCIMRKKATVLKSIRADIADALQQTMNAADKYVAEPVQEHPVASTLTAGLAGYVLGKCINERDFF
jgi:membrane-bound ClpP family serine protease